MTGQAQRVPDFTVRPGLPTGQRKAAARIYWSAFGRKLGRVMGPERKGLAFVERVISERHVISATDATGAIVGVIGFRNTSGSFVGGERADMVAIYGLPGSLWRMACLAVLSRDREARALIVDGLAVAEEWRGAGIGAALIEALAVEAATRGYRELRLDVVGQNLRARALYERLGFRVARRRDSRVTRALFAFETVFVMIRPL